MSPEQVSILTTLLGVIQAVSSWPFGVIAFLFLIGPWLLNLFLAYFFKRRFEEVVRMYENNVSLVKNYEKVSGDLKDVIILNTQTMTTLIETIKAGGRYG